MSGHTPGPWEVTKAGFDRHLIRHALRGKGHVPGYIAEVNNIGSSFDANARLIAAAPELLEALQWMVDNDDTNEGDEPLPDHGGLTWNEINSLFIAGLNKARAAIARATGAQA